MCSRRSIDAHADVLCVGRFFRKLTVEKAVVRNNVSFHAYNGMRLLTFPRKVFLSGGQELQREGE